MDKKAIFKHFSDVIDTLIDSSMWMETWFQRPYCLDSHIDGKEYGELPDNIHIRDGATRACIIDDDYDWVIKFDINDDDGSACDRERELFRAAKAYALDEYFCEMDYIGTYTKQITFYNIDDIERCCDWYGYDPIEFDLEIMQHEEEMDLHSIMISIPLYAYRRANYYDYGKLDESLISSAQKIYSPLRAENVAIATAFIQEYGYNEYEAITEFALENDINDIHMGNVGEIDGHLVIIDYAGYHSSIYK